MRACASLCRSLTYANVSPRLTWSPSAAHPRRSRNSFGSICGNTPKSRRKPGSNRSKNSRRLNMVLIFESENFDVITPEQPHVSRSDGGHLIINPKVPVEDRTRLSREQAIELIKLTMVSGEAMKTVLTQKGIEIGRINYQDNGNWRHE